jgi:hypothetical protein
MDYFIFTAGLFRYGDFPPFIIGRVRYDNWINMYTEFCLFFFFFFLAPSCALWAVCCKGTCEERAREIPALPLWM